jgi:hypothetical protein
LFCRSDRGGRSSGGENHGETASTSWTCL